MMMDVGYCLFVLCGTILGSLVVGRYSSAALSKSTVVFVLAVAVAELD